MTDHYIQRLENLILSTKHSLSTLNLTRQGTQSELNDLIRSSTEVECIIADLRSSSSLDGDKRSAFEAELANVEAQIGQKERELATLIPKWDAQKAKESMERRKAQEASTQLGALFAKQGRVNRFRTKGERDAFLKGEIASVGSYKTTRSAALESTREELDIARRTLEEVKERTAGVHESIDDGRKRVRDLGEQLTALKDEQAELAERRKELWREETKLNSMLSHAMDQKRTAENHLASMMDKVGQNSCFGRAQYDFVKRIQGWVYVLWIELRNVTGLTVFMVLCTACLRSLTQNSILQLN